MLFELYANFVKYGGEGFLFQTRERQESNYN